MKESFSDSKRRIGILVPKSAHWSVIQFLSGLNLGEFNDKQKKLLLILENNDTSVLSSIRVPGVEIASDAWSTNDQSSTQLFSTMEKYSVNSIIIPGVYPYVRLGEVAGLVKSQFQDSVAITAIIFDPHGISELASGLCRFADRVLCIDKADYYSAISEGVATEKLDLFKYPFSSAISGDDADKEARHISEIAEIFVPATGLNSSHYEQIVKAVYDLEKNGIKVRFTIMRSPLCTFAGDQSAQIVSGGYAFPKEFVSDIELRGLKSKIRLIETPGSLDSFRSEISRSSLVLSLASGSASSIERRAITIACIELGVPLCQSQSSHVPDSDDIILGIPDASDETLSSVLLRALVHPVINTLIKESFNLIVNRSLAATDKLQSLASLVVEPPHHSISITKDNNKPEVVLNLAEPLPRILMQNRENAFSHPGGDSVVMQRLIEGLESEGFDVVVDLENKEDVTKFDLVHLFNFAIREVVESQARNCVSSGTPYVVTSLYEDWPAFFNQMAQMYVALEAYVNYGQPSSNWAELESAARSISPSDRWDNSFSANHAEAVITTGDSETKSVLRDYPGVRRVLSVPLGCEVSERLDGGDLFKERYGLENFVLCVGRLEWRKNQLMLLKALEDTDYEIVFAASNFTYQPKYSELCRKFTRKRGKTHFLERLTPDELASAYQAARVHALPSWFELPGLVTLEAGKYGVSLVVSDTGTTRDYTGDFAEYCNPDSAESIKRAVDRAWEKGRSTITAAHFQQFTWDNTVKNYARIYREVLNSKESLITLDTGSIIKSSEVNNEAFVVTMTDVVAEDQVVRLNQESTSEFKEKIGDSMPGYVELCMEGDKALKNGLIEEARSLFNKAFDLDPSLPRAIRSLGAVLIHQGKTEEADPYFSRALSQDPGDVRSLLGKGAVLWARGEKEKAFSLYLQASDLDPGDSSVVLYLVNAAYELEKLSQLETCLRKYLREKPDNTSIQYCLAGCYFKQKKYSSAMGIVERLLAISSDNSDAMELKEEIEKRINQQGLGATTINNIEIISEPETVKSANQYQSPEVFLSSESFDTSTMDSEDSGVSSDSHSDDNNILINSEEINRVQINESFKKGLDNGAVEIHKLEGLKQAKKYEEVLDYASKLIESDFYTLEATYCFKVFMAESLGALARIDEARIIFQELYRQDLYKCKVCSGLAVLLAFEEKWADASSYFEEALSHDPSADVPLAGLGMCARSLGNTEDAWNYFSEALRRNPENMQAIFGLIQLGYELSRLSEVERFLRTYLDLQPVDLSILYSLAGCLYAQGRTGEALSELKNILIFEPEHTHAKELLERIQEGSRFDSGRVSSIS
ncbi:MAG TPA: tetratricopeptide repeat protein [Oligoflexia bacterium]|nr:tetratricopeptide repeat protein [Oligoflexia bacterium]HMP47644.1 tetratricopeptide repeat protein [Oligoflexia bacterium]